MPTVKICLACQTLRDASEFSKDSAHHNFDRKWCDVCVDVRKRLAVERVTSWRASNYDRFRKTVTDRRNANPEQFRKWGNDWQKRNPGYVNAKTARRRSALYMATPNWIDHAKVKSIYDEAARLTRETGIPHAVDHIVPLQSRLVCGLHWHVNLQILTKQENTRKLNRHWPDMP